jgi:hypothetical protein
MLHAFDYGNNTLHHCLPLLATSGKMRMPPVRTKSCTGLNAPLPDDWSSSSSIITIIIFMDSAMLGLFRPLEKYVGPSILTVGALCFVVLLGCMLKFSLAFLYLPFEERAISTLI